MTLFQKRLLTWGSCAIILIGLPLIFQQDFALSIFSRICIAIIFALSYNMLLGQGGMLSFGHAAYSGLGAYITIHALNAVSAGEFFFPITLLPLVGGIAGLLFGIPLGYISTKRPGLTFAMITLGIGELVAASVLMLPGFFGGEDGISGNRVTSEGWFGIDYGSQLQMYYLIAFWTFTCAIGMYALTHTPLGRMANAVRDNAIRASFVGYDTHKVRFYTLVLSAFFAGIGGGLAALNYEFVSAENVGFGASSSMLLMTLIGGIGQFFGPVLGAIFVTFLNTLLSTFTNAWPFYFGLIFLLTILFVPGGFSSLIVIHKPAWREGLMKLLHPAYGFCVATMLFLVPGVILLIEMCYHVSGGGSPTMHFFGFELNTESALPWVSVIALISIGLTMVRYAKTIVSRAWQQVTDELNLRQGAAASGARGGAVPELGLGEGVRI